MRIEGLGGIGVFRFRIRGVEGLGLRIEQWGQGRYAKAELEFRLSSLPKPIFLWDLSTVYAAKNPVHQGLGDIIACSMFFELSWVYGGMEAVNSVELR